MAVSKEKPRSREGGASPFGREERCALVPARAKAVRMIPPGGRAGQISVLAAKGPAWQLGFAKTKYFHGDRNL